MKHIENTNFQKTPMQTPLSPQKGKILDLLNACCLNSLAAKNFYLNLCSSPFLTYGNGRGMNVGIVFESLQC
jgi:hypothetical protein